MSNTRPTHQDLTAAGYEITSQATLDQQRHEPLFFRHAIKENHPVDRHSHTSFNTLNSLNSMSDGFASVWDETAMSFLVAAFQLEIRTRSQRTISPPAISRVFALRVTPSAQNTSNV